MQKKARTSPGFLDVSNRGLLRAPAAVHVGVTYHFSVGNRADASADLGLGGVWLNSGFASARALAPQQLHFGADCNVGINSAQRQHAALVVGVAGEHGQTNNLVTTHNS